MPVSVSRRLLEPGDRVGRFEIVADVAQGGMASVHVARLTSIGGFGKLVALKVLLPHLRTDRAFVNMLLDEARIAAAIQHANVVQVLDVAEEDGSPYVAMELLRGHSLRSVQRALRRRRQALPLGAILGVVARAAEGLHAAHQATDTSGAPLGVIHRDVSPENIHLGYDGQVKVLDFGIAAAAGRLTETMHGELKGKAQYLAPEQLSKSRPADHRVDVWALGVVAHELLTSRRPFAGEDMATTMWNVLNLEVPDLREVVPDLPADASAILRASLDRVVEGRPASCAEIMRVLDDAAGRLGGGTTAELSALMQDLYVEERAAEDERIAAAVRGRLVPDPGDESTAPEVPVDAVTTVADGRRRTNRPLALLAALVLAGSAGVAATIVLDPGSSSPPPPAAQQSPPDAAGTMPEASEVPADIALTQITVDIDERARLVLVDGERRDERPLSIAIGQDPVHVELVGPRGEIVAHDLGPDSDGARLELPPAPDRRRGSAMVNRARRGSAMAPMVTMEPSRDIVRDVF